MTHAPTLSWLNTAIALIEADYQRSADTHLIPLNLPCFARHGIDLYLKDESTHPTGSVVDYLPVHPSNPWVAVGWRNRETVKLPIAPLLEKRGIGFCAKAVRAIDAPTSTYSEFGGEFCRADYLCSPRSSGSSVDVLMTLV